MYYLFRFYKNKQIFIWFSNLCFDEKINVEVFQKLINELPNNSIIGCSKQPTELNNLELLNTVNIQMSWGDNSSTYIYIIKKN
jgi:hypothetical protein